MTAVAFGTSAAAFGTREAVFGTSAVAYLDYNVKFRQYF